MADRDAPGSVPREMHDVADEPSSRGQRMGHASTGGHFKSRVVKRSVVVAGHKTSVSLEDVFWNELRAIAQQRGIALSQLVGHIDSERRHSNLSSAIRMFVFELSRSRGIAATTNRREVSSSAEPQPAHRAS